MSHSKNHYSFSCIIVLNGSTNVFAEKSSKTFKILWAEGFFVCLHRFQNIVSQIFHLYKFNLSNF